MSDRTKRILLIIGFILAAILIGLAIYLVFFRPIFSPSVAPTNLNQATNINALPSGLPGTLANVNAPVSTTNINATPITSAYLGPTISDKANGGITMFSTLSDDSALALNFTSNGSLNYFDKKTGFFYTLKPDGTKVKLSDLGFTNVSSVVWAPNSEKAIIVYADGSKIIYNFSQKKYVTLPSQWQDFSFSSDSKQIAFKDMKVDSTSRYLSISDPSTGNYKQIEALGDNGDDVSVQWSPTGSFVALYSKSTSGETAEVYPIGLNGENYTSITIEGRDPRFVYSPSGKQLVYSVYNISSSYKPTLWVVSADTNSLGTGRNKIGIDTWADKCSFASDTVLYCAVPTSLDTGAGFNPSLADSTPDQFYKIELSSGTTQLIAQPLYPTTVEDLVVSPDGSSLIWTEKNSGEIKKINL